MKWTLGLRKGCTVGKSRQLPVSIMLKLIQAILCNNCTRHLGNYSGPFIFFPKLYAPNRVAAMYRLTPGPSARKHSRRLAQPAERFRPQGFHCVVEGLLRKFACWSLYALAAPEHNSGPGLLFLRVSGHNYTL